MRGRLQIVRTIFLGGAQAATKKRQDNDPVMPTLSCAVSESTLA